MRGILIKFLIILVSFFYSLESFSVTLRQAGTSNTGNRSLALYGVATLMCVASNTFVISGVGLS